MRVKASKPVRRSAPRPILRCRRESKDIDPEFTRAAEESTRSGSRRRALRQARKESAMSHLDFASIEVSKKELKVIVLRDGRILKPRDFTNAPRGHQAVCGHLERDGRTVRAVLEATGVYSRDLVVTLSRRPGIEVMVLSASYHDPYISRFKKTLTGRGKKPLVALTAVMRKLLHSIYGMLKNDTPFEGRLFYRS